MRGAKRFAVSESTPEINDTAFRNKRTISGSRVDDERAETSSATLDVERAESSLQHVRALNTQFASWVQAQLKNHPDELWEDGVRDYLSHASNIMEKFSDVVNWLKANSTKGGPAADSLNDGKNSVPDIKNNNDSILLQGKSGFSLPSTTTSFTAPWSSGAFSNNQSSGGAFSSSLSSGGALLNSHVSGAAFSGSLSPGGVFFNNQSSGGIFSNCQSSGGIFSNSQSSGGIFSNSQSSGGIFSNSQSSGFSSDNQTSGSFSNSRSTGLFSTSQSPGFFSSSSSPSASSAGQSSGLFSTAVTFGLSSTNQSTGLFSKSQSSAAPSANQSSGLFSNNQSTGVFSKTPPPFSFGQNSTATINNATENADDENELEQPSSPSVKKSEEKGVVVVHEVKCRLYVKSSDTSDAKSAWKEKGSGQLSIKCKEGIDKGTKESKPTIIVRNDVGKVILNALLYPGIKTTAQKTSLVAIFHTAGDDGGDTENVVARTFLIRTRSEEDRSKLATAIQEYAPQS